jgi:hypothetical protein
MWPAETSHMLKGPPKPSLRAARASPRYRIFVCRPPPGGLMPWRMCADKFLVHLPRPSPALMAARDFAVVDLHDFEGQPARL